MRGVSPANATSRYLVATWFLAAALLLSIAVVTTAEPLHAQVTPLDEEPDESPTLGRITGSPEAGPKPEDPGDRGGWAQLTLAVVMAGGVGFIGFQIARQVRHNEAHHSDV